MTTATASVVDVPRTDNAIRARNSGQCLPIPLPALGTQRIVQGNGTSVGTVISLQCPDRHRLMGGLVCVWGSNSTQWSGDTPWCEPLPDDVGFRVAVLASIVSSVIILLMSTAFITCCLLDCVKKLERKKEERETSLWQQQNRSFRYHNKGRNNNNNNNDQEKNLPLWDNHDPALCDHRPCRCQQHRYTLTSPSPDSTFGTTLPSASPPGRGYNLQPVRPVRDPSQYSGAPVTTGLLQSSALSPSSGSGGQESDDVSAASRPLVEDSHRTSQQPLRAQECSIRFISV